MLRTPRSQHSAPPQPHVFGAAFRVLVACLLPVVLVGCVTLKRPVGDWAEPVDLRIPRQALAGASVGVECDSAHKDEAKLTPATFTACRQLVQLLKAMGASVTAAPGVMPDEPDVAAANDAQAADAKTADADDEDEEPVDFTVRYVDRGGHRDFGGWTAPLFLLSFSLFPDVEDLHADAELDMLDGGGQLFAKHPLKIEIVKIYGPAALYYMLTELLPGRGRARSRELAANLGQYVQDVVYTYRQRLQVSAPAKQVGAL